MKQSGDCNSTKTSPIVITIVVCLLLGVPEVEEVQIEEADDDPEYVPPDSESIESGRETRAWRAPERPGS